MKKLWDGTKAFLDGKGYTFLLAFMSIGVVIFYLYEPFPQALNAFLESGDLIPLLLLFDLIGTLLAFSISAVLLTFGAITWAWFPFAVGTLFVLPKLIILHLGMVQEPFGHFLSAYTILAGAAPGTYFGWRISRAAVKKQEEANPLNWQDDENYKD